MTAGQCPADMEWTECVSTSGNTCDSLKSESAITPDKCLPGCRCSSGKVLDRSAGASGRCVEPSACSCRFKGAVHPAQSTITIECNDWSVFKSYLSAYINGF